MWWGQLWNEIRIFCCRRIFKYCGKVSTINRHAYFGNGRNVEIGDYSGIGENCVIPNNIIIGKYVMMAPKVYIVPMVMCLVASISPCVFKAQQDVKIKL